VADLADLAFSHCLAVTGSAEAAADAAAHALRRGGWSRTSVLGHAAHLAVKAAPAAPSDDGPVSGSGAGVTDLARWLAATRPPTERALIDLADHYGLGTAGLARVIGASPEDAASRLATVSASWEDQLDPALMAWLGPGSCPALAEVLGAPAGEGGAAADGAPIADPAAESDGTPPLSARSVLGLASRVNAHVEACDVCADRRRAMVSVRAVLAREPLSPAPAPVRAAARASRRRPVPVPAPPLGGARRFPPRWAAAIPVAAAAAAVAYLAWPSGGAGPTPSAGAVSALTRLPAGGSALELVAPRITGANGTVTLLNIGPTRIAWRAAASAPWLGVSPGAGHLDPGRFAVLALTVSTPPPVGALRVTVSVSGDDGSAAATTLQVGPSG